MTRITILTALSIILLSCGPTEDDKHHPYIYFHNTTNDSLYVTFTAKGESAGFGILANPQCAVMPHSTNKDALSPMWQTWEDYFRRDYVDTITVWISEYNLIKNSGSDYIDMDNGVQCYFLSLDDLMRLNFQISYPPIKTMRFIKMLPTYEDAIAGKTLQDIDLEQEEQ